MCVHIYTYVCTYDVDCLLDNYMHSCYYIFIQSRIVNCIQRLLDVTSDEEFIIRIRREDVLEDALIAVSRIGFSHYKTVVVRVCVCAISICISVI